MALGETKAIYPASLNKGPGLLDILLPKKRARGLESCALNPESRAPRAHVVQITRGLSTPTHARCNYKSQARTIHSSARAIRSSARTIYSLARTVTARRARLQLGARFTAK